MLGKVKTQQDAEFGPSRVSAESDCYAEAAYGSLSRHSWGDPQSVQVLRGSEGDSPGKARPAIGLEGTEEVTGGGG